MRFWRFRLAYRSDVRDRLQALPAIPEAERMTTKPKERAKVRSIRAWMTRYDGERKRA